MSIVIADSKPEIRSALRLFLSEKPCVHVVEAHDVCALLRDRDGDGRRPLERPQLAEPSQQLDVLRRRPAEPEPRIEDQHLLADAGRARRID